MADSVGTVYVKVVSDSEGFKQSLNKTMKADGRAAARQFGVSFDKGIQKDFARINMGKYLDPQIKRMSQRIARGVTDANGELRKLGDDIEFNIGDIISPDELAKLSKQLNLEVADVSAYIRKELPAAYRDSLNDVERDAKKSIQRRQTFETDAFKTTVRKMAEQIQQGLTPAMRKAFRDGGGNVDFIDVEGAEAQFKRLAKTYQIEMTDATDAVRRELVKVNKERSKGGRIVDRTRYSMRKLGEDTTALDRSMRRLNVRFKTFGRRSAVLNVITNLMGAVAFRAYRMGRAFTAVLKPVEGLFKSLGSAISGVAENMGALGKPLNAIGSIVSGLGSAIGSSLSAGIAGVAGLAAAAVALVSVLGAVAQVISALIAGVVALGSALYLAAANAALLVPLLGALGVGFVGVIVGGWDASKAVFALAKAMNETDPKKRAEAFKEYEKALGKLGPNARKAVKALRPLITAFDGIKERVGEALFDGMADSLKGLQGGPIEGVITGLEGIAEAVGDVIEGFLDLAQDTVFMQSFNTMMETSAQIIRDLGSAFTDTFAGLTNLFATISPLIEEFSGGIADAAADFREWTETAGGQNAILEFFTLARDMGSLVWEVLKNLGGALHDLFTDDATVGAAESFLTFINDEITRFRDWIAEVSENGKLAQWFADAEAAGRIMWDVILLLVDAFGKLLTPQSLAALKLIGLLFAAATQQVVFLINGVGLLVQAFTGMFNMTKSGFKSLISFAGQVWKEIQKIAPSFDQVRSAARWFIDSVVSGFRNISRWVNNVISAIRRIKWPTPPSWMRSLAGNTIGRFFADGGIVTGATRSVIGEAGAEAVIPLHRPLAQVDPSVRSMAAMIRGGDGAASPTSVSNSRQMTNHWTINSPNPDGRVVASQVVNRLAAEMT